MGIENEAAEEMVSAVGNGVERALPLAEQLAKEAISDVFKKTSVRQALNDIKQSRRNKPDLGKTIEKAVKKIGGAR